MGAQEKRATARHFHWWMTLVQESASHHTGASAQWTMPTLMRSGPPRDRGNTKHAKPNLRQLTLQEAWQISQKKFVASTGKHNGGGGNGDDKDEQAPRPTTTRPKQNEDRSTAEATDPETHGTSDLGAGQPACVAKVKEDENDKLGKMAVDSEGAELNDKQNNQKDSVKKRESMGASSEADHSKLLEKYGGKDDLSMTEAAEAAAAIKAAIERANELQEKVAARTITAAEVKELCNIMEQANRHAEKTTTDRLAGKPLQPQPQLNPSNKKRGKKKT